MTTQADFVPLRGRGGSPGFRGVLQSLQADDRIWFIAPTLHVPAACPVTCLASLLPMDVVGKSIEKSFVTRGAQFVDLVDLRILDLRMRNAHG